MKLTTMIQVLTTMIQVTIDGTQTTDPEAGR